MTHPDYIIIPITPSAAMMGKTGTTVCDNMEFLATQIENMRYDKVEELIGALSKRFLRRSLADANAGKCRLAQELNEVAEHLSFADAALRAFCKTHMKEDKND